MKWALAAVGALLAIFGLSAILSGYPIVEVERGWALVIAGTTALSAGIVTIGLAAVIARMDRLAHEFVAKIRAEASAQPIAEAAPIRKPIREKPRDEQPTAPAEPIGAREAEEALALSESKRRRPFVLGPAPPPPQSAAPPAPPAAFPSASPPAPETPETEATSLMAGAEEPLAEDAATARQHALESGDSEPRWPERGAPESEPAQQSPESAQSPVVRFRRFPLRNLNLPRGPWPDSPLAADSPLSPEGPPESSTPADQIMPASPVVEASSAEAPSAYGAWPIASDEDWLERALAGSEQQDEPAAASAPAAPVQTEEAPASDAHYAQASESANSESALSDAAPEDAFVVGGEPQGEAEPEAGEALVEPASARAILGRYETEAAVYVMYSDGSIDAETPNGVYTFDSLAALKAHIEKSNETY